MPCRLWGLDGLYPEIQVAAFDAVVRGTLLVSVRM